MKKPILILLTTSFLIILSAQFGLLVNIQKTAEKIIVSLFTGVYKNSCQEENSLKVLGLKEQNKKLTQQNQVLRKQLGAIPEKANLLPLAVVWQSDSALMVSFNYQPKNENWQGRPVILNDVFIGKVGRIGEAILIVNSPVSSGFRAQAVSDRGAEGQVKGQFDNQVVFQTSNQNSLQKGDSIYYLEPSKGWRFLLGKVSEVDKDKRQPLKQAIIDYLPAKAKLKTVFLVI